MLTILKKWIQQQQQQQQILPFLKMMFSFVFGKKKRWGGFIRLQMSNRI